MEPGSFISHYRIVSRLGAGGMGEVYLAQDERLERFAAVKVLANAATADPQSLKRFTQEAKAAAALSHPNIAHIYDAGEENGTPFLAMEYVEGRTLSNLIEEAPFEATVVIELAAQVADALDEAHRKGIVHRDIKPSNLIRNMRGQVKVLDFGLAKLSAAAKIQMARDTISSDAVTDSGAVTAGAVGSLPYMSPEQALGKDVDGRTDVFSLGAVLYELSTGRRAFTGTTPAAVFDAILNRTPQNPKQLNPAIPDGLDRLIRRCLEKNPAMRYQSAADLLADLRMLQRENQQLTTTHSGIHFHSKPDSRQWRWILSIAGLTVLVSAILGWNFAKRDGGPKEPVVPLRTVPLTSFPGNESFPSFSPDGNQVAFSWNQNREEDLDIYVKVVEAGMPLRLTNTPASEYSPAWSPDGRYIAFLRESADTAGFYLIPALGGLERKLADASPHRVGADAPYISWSPDGKQLAIVDRENPSAPLSIMLLDFETTAKRRVTSPPRETLGDSSPSFSPDGNSIVFVRTTSLSVQDLWIVNLADGRERRVTTDGKRVFGIAWNQAANDILYSTSRQANTRLWRVSPDGGAPRPVVGFGDSAGFVALSKNGRRMAYSRSITDTNIWRYRLPDRLTPVPDGIALLSSTRQEQGPRYSPDGSRIVFSSNRSGSLEIWVSDGEGGTPSQLTRFNGPATGTPIWSPDGKFIVFDSRPGGNPDVYIVSADGGTPRRLTTDTTEELVPSWSRDGRWIYFTSNRTGRHELWKMPEQGGIASQITTQGAFHGVESLDGQYLYYAKGANQPGLWRVGVGGGVEESVLPQLKAGYWSYWTFAKDGVYFVDREDLPQGGARYLLNHFNFATKKITTLTYLSRRPYNNGLTLSPDGKYFLYTQVDTAETDIFMVDGFR